MILGIISLVASCCCFAGGALGGLAILFACLSRVEPKMSSQAKVGLVTGIIGIVLSVIMLILLGVYSYETWRPDPFSNFHFHYYYH